MQNISLGTFAVAAALGAATPALAVQPGDTAPDFSLPSLQGVTTTLGQFRGELVLLAFVGYG